MQSTVGSTSEASPPVSTACLTRASRAVSLRSCIPAGDVIVLMVLGHVLRPYAGCLQRTHSGGQRARILFFCLFFVADCGGKACHSRKEQEKSCSRQLVFIMCRQKPCMSQLEFGWVGIFWSFCESLLNSEEGLLRRDVLFLWEWLERKCNVTPTFTVYTPVSCFPPTGTTLSCSTAESPWPWPRAHVMRWGMWTACTASPRGTQSPFPFWARHLRMGG